MRLNHISAGSVPSRIALFGSADNYARITKARRLVMIRFLTSGESHGKGLAVIIEGLPYGLKIQKSFIMRELTRRRSGYGRSSRMKHKIDTLEILSGFKDQKTTGSPITLFIGNESFVEKDAREAQSVGNVKYPRPGHADLSGALKLLVKDLTVISERSSARETAARVAAGALFKLLLKHFGISILSHTLSVGKIKCSDKKEVSWINIEKIPDDSPLRCHDKKREVLMVREIDKAARRGDSVGGSFQVVARGVPAGLGSFIQWDKRLEGLIAQAIFSIPGIKAAEVGKGIAGASTFGSSYHDQISYDRRDLAFKRKSNNAGGIEGGVTNGEEIRVAAYFKPIATIAKSLISVDLANKTRNRASHVRSDICPIVAASVVGESMLAYVLADSVLQKFGGDSIKESLKNYHSYIKFLQKY
jgi:chorismate synthase